MSRVLGRVTAFPGAWWPSPKKTVCVESRLCVDSRCLSGTQGSVPHPSVGSHVPVPALRVDSGPAVPWAAMSPTPEFAIRWCRTVSGFPSAGRHPPSLWAQRCCFNSVFLCQTRGWVSAGSVWVSPEWRLQETKSRCPCETPSPG